MNNKVILGVLGLLTLASIALAGVVEDRYLPVRIKNSAGQAQTTAFASHRSIVDGSEDSRSSLTNYDLQDIGGDTLLVVAPRFTAQGASCQVQLWLYQSINGTNTLLGVSAIQTATATDGTLATQVGSGGDYLPVGNLYFDTAGADKVDIRYPAISSGTVKSCAWTLGANGRAAD